MNNLSTITMRTYLFVVTVLLGLTKLAASTTDDLHRSEFIKDHSTEIANVFQNFNIMIQPVLLIDTFVPPVVCIISKEELEEIWKEIERQESAELGHPANFQYSENCNELEKIKTGIMKLKYDFKQLLKESVSSVKYEELKASYEEKMRLLIKRLDDEKKTAEGEHLESIRQLQNELQKQQNEINRILKQLELEQEKLHEAYVDLCVSLISQNEIQAASDAFKKITKPSTIERIVNTSYSNRADNFENIILLLRRIDDRDVVEMGHRCLYNKLSADNRISHMYGIILANEMKDETSILRTLLYAQVESMVYENHLDSFIDYANNRGSSRDVLFVKEVIPMIDRMAYNKPPQSTFANVQFLMTLQRRFTNAHHQWYMLIDVTSLIKSYGHSESKLFFPILSDATVRLNFNKDNFITELINEFTKQLPESLRIFMSSTVCIKNDETGEFLQIGVNDEVISGVTIKPDKMQLKFGVNEEGLVNIINAKTNQHLAVSVNFDNDVHNVIAVSGMWTKDYYTQMFFNLEKLGDDKFTIKNSRVNEYLYSMKIFFLPSTGYSSSKNNYCTWLIKECSSFN